MTMEPREIALSSIKFSAMRSCLLACDIRCPKRLCGGPYGTNLSCMEAVTLSEYEKKHEFESAVDDTFYHFRRKPHLTIVRQSKIIDMQQALIDALSKGEDECEYESQCYVETIPEDGRPMKLKVQKSNCKELLEQSPDSEESIEITDDTEGDVRTSDEDDYEESGLPEHCSSAYRTEGVTMVDDHKGSITEGVCGLYCPRKQHADQSKCDQMTHSMEQGRTPSTSAYHKSLKPILLESCPSYLESMSETPPSSAKYGIGCRNKKDEVICGKKQNFDHGKQAKQDEQKYTPLCPLMNQIMYALHKSSRGEVKRDNETLTSRVNSKTNEDNVCDMAEYASVPFETVKPINISEIPQYNNKTGICGEGRHGVTSNKLSGRVKKDKTHSAEKKKKKVVEAQSDNDSATMGLISNLNLDEHENDNNVIYEDIQGLHHFCDDDKIKYFQRNKTEEEQEIASWTTGSEMGSWSNLSSDQTLLNQPEQNYDLKQKWSVLTSESEECFYRKNQAIQVMASFVDHKKPHKFKYTLQEEMQTQPNNMGKIVSENVLPDPDLLNGSSNRCELQRQPMGSNILAQKYSTDDDYTMDINRKSNNIVETREDREDKHMLGPKDTDLLKYGDEERQSIISSVRVKSRNNYSANKVMKPLHSKGVNVCIRPQNCVSKKKEKKTCLEKPMERDDYLAQ